MKRIGLLLLVLAAGLAGCGKADPADTTDPSKPADISPSTDITAGFDPLFARELQKRGYIADPDNITFKDVMRVTILNVAGERVWVPEKDEYEYDGKLTSLKGIEYFESLIDLYCYGNQLTSLDVSKNTALEFLDGFCNPLTTLDVSKNTALRRLYCHHCQLTSLNVSSNPALRELHCESNQLTALDLSKDTALTKLHCEDNRLTALDLSNNTALTILFCLDNRLTSLDISNNTALTEMGCGNNPGDGRVFPVTAWFDNDSIPLGFTTGNWPYGGVFVKIDYRKAE